MAFEEKRAWIGGLIAIITYTAYVAVVVTRSGDGPITEVSYVAPLLWIIGAGVLAAIVLHAAIGIAARDEAGKADERDREIGRMGEHVGQSFLVIGAVAALGMAMAEWDHFWIANVIVLAFFLSSMLESVARIVAYHRAFQPW